VLGWLGSAVSIVTAVLLAAHVIGLLRLRQDIGGSMHYPIAVLVSTVGLAVAAVFPMDPSLGFPPGADPAVVPSVAGAVHDVAGPTFLLGLDYAGIWPGAWSGLFERLAAYIGLGWVALTAYALRRASS